MATGTVLSGGWKHIGSGTGSNSVALPTDSYWTDVFVKVYFPLNTSVCWLYNEPRIAIPQAYNDNGASPANGASGSDRQACSIVIAWNQGVYVREYIREGTNYTSQATFDVWVKY